MEVIFLKMRNSEIGNMVTVLRDGKSVVCPECKTGKIIPQKENDNFFKCDCCDFSIRLNRK